MEMVPRSSIVLFCTIQTSKCTVPLLVLRTIALAGRSNAQFKRIALATNDPPGVSSWVTKMQLTIGEANLC